MHAEGLSYRGIAVRLDGEGIKPKPGKRWIHTTVKSILERNAADTERDRSRCGAWVRAITRLEELTQHAPICQGERTA
jgi:hypothetical protein